MRSIYVTIVLAPLIACVIGGLFGKTIGRVGAQSVTILGVAVSCAPSFYVLYQQVFEGLPPFNGTVYTWLLSDGLQLNVGVLVDHLSAFMMAVVSFVSFVGHHYTI